jgi:hypothetical protein
MIEICFATRPQARSYLSLLFFFGPWTRFLSINLFVLRLKKSEERIPSDFYYVKSHIGFPFGYLQHVIFMNENGNKLHE